MSGSPHRVLTPVLGAVLVLAVLLIPAASAAPLGAALSPSSSGSSTQTWGFGGSEWGYATGTTTDGQWTYSIHAFLGVQVVLRQVNTSASTFELTANRTMVADVFGILCHPSCSRATITVNLSRRASEVTYASDNFTTSGQVTGPLGPVAAVALLNSSVTSAANLTERATWNVSGLLGSGQGSAYLSVHSAAEASVAFSPGLGLVPENLTATPNWTSSSAFSGQGSWSVGFLYAHTPLNGTTSRVTGAANGTLARSGNVSLVGSVTGSLVLQNGVPVTAIALAITGPFSLRDGVVLVPSGANLFGGTGTWQADDQASQSASTTAVDYSRSGSARPNLEASATRFAATPSEPSTVVTATSMAAPASLGPAEATVQAQPETAGQATGDSSCLLTGTCPASPQGPASPVRLGGAIVLAVAVVGLTVVVVGLVVARQPPRKAPPSPNANLYPTGSVRPPPPPGRSATPPPSTPAEDPLSHLW
jgi:hypothetical protein